MREIEQFPAPGTHRALCRGDLLEFRLRRRNAGGGTAWLRTNLGAAATARAEIIAAAEGGRARLARDWRDRPMPATGPDEYALRVPLAETGCFEAKCFFQARPDAAPEWPDGGNVSISVAPAHTVCANGVYNAFTRQFSKRRPSRATSGRDYSGVVDARAGAVSGPSGTFRDLAARLDFIIDELGCRYLLLLPVHPVPAIYGRMGLYGSPYAATDFFAVEPALARFDRAATPMDQFRELADGVHARGACLLLDIAINHCGWAATLHARRPEWIVRDTDGAMRSPGAWGTVWHDLTELDYGRRDLWRYMTDALLFWCRRGVDGFRCDAGYMVPFDAWEYIIAGVREQYPDTVFLLEGLGGKLSVTRRLLRSAGFNWAYSELFQQYSREQVEAYLGLAQDISFNAGILVNFAETHDNPRLAAKSRAEARLRTALAALLSHQGAFAFANGVEWLATEKIDVHGNADLNWGAPVNQVAAIARLNALLRAHPAFHPGVPLESLQCGPGPVLAVLRGARDDCRRLLILANLDTRKPALAVWDAPSAGFGGGRYPDLLNERTRDIAENNGRTQCPLEPGAVVCLAAAGGETDRRDEDAVSGHAGEPLRVRLQRARAKVLELLAFWRGFEGVNPEELNELAAALLENPGQTAARLAGCVEDRVVCWQWPRDLRRHVMIPPDHALMICAPAPFRVELHSGVRTLATETALPEGGGGYSALALVKAPGESADLRIRVFHKDGIRHGKSRVRFLPPIERLRVPVVFPASALPPNEGIVLCANRLGGMSRAGAIWGAISSRYDALLAANLHPDHPVDRRVLLTRCRAWVVCRGHSHALDGNCLASLDMRDARAPRWRFSGPFAPPDEWNIDLSLEAGPAADVLRLAFRITPAIRARETAAPETPGDFALILRPDIEDRSFHDDTLAYTGPERDWPAAVRIVPGGFEFQPFPEHYLKMLCAEGTFTPEPEWTYQVAHPREARRGMRPAADLFSPGFFRIPLTPSKPCALSAAAVPASQDRRAGIGVSKSGPADAAGTGPGPWMEGADGLESVLARAMQAYIVRRGANKTVIAGYPWFLDWGRDTLIFTRGLIAAGMYAESAEILSQFAVFEKGGTLPNMIRGDDARDRDTSDAPLWFAVACADLARAGKGRPFLEERLGDGRCLPEVVESIVDAYIAGTTNGIRVDEASGLVFSPAHFTWMDTNYPAATPREGYPVEIQALWHAALVFLGDITGDTRRRELAQRVLATVREKYFLAEHGYFADCLHARPGDPAARARADDALRPNQLFLLTLAESEGAREIAVRALRACGELAVPGALRSLADRPVRHPIPVDFHGRRLNDPSNPYWGRYEGDEDTRRKPAYHNGTAWCWLYPAYVEAWWRTYGAGSRDTALALLGAVAPLLREGCLLQLPELLEGDAPHRQRGCDAQAWSVSETYRVLRLLREAAG